MWSPFLQKLFIQFLNKKQWSHPFSSILWSQTIILGLRKRRHAFLIKSVKTLFLPKMQLFQLFYKFFKKIQKFLKKFKKISKNCKIFNQFLIKKISKNDYSFLALPGPGPGVTQKYEHFCEKNWSKIDQNFYKIFYKKIYEIFRNFWQFFTIFTKNRSFLIKTTVLC